MGTPSQNVDPAQNAPAPATSRAGAPAARLPPRPRTRGPPRSPPGPKKRSRTFMALVVIGLVIALTGGALALTFYPYVVHARSASQFLSDSNAQFAQSKEI